MNSHRPPRALLFDLDGTLVDSEPLKGQAFADSLRPFGIVRHPRLYAEVMGRGWPKVLEHLFQDAVTVPEPQAFIALFRQRYLRLVEAGVRLMPGARELVAAARRKGLDLALVTSETSPIVASILAQLGLAETFACRVTREEVAHSKPDPEAYLLALQRLGREPGEVLAFEDSEAGLRAATAAGCRCVVMRHGFNGGHDLSAALQEIRDYRELRPELIGQLDLSL